MNCSDFENNITAFIDGELGKSNRSKFTSHRNNCLECNRKLENLKLLIQSLSNVHQVKTSPSFLVDLHTKIEQSQQGKVPFLKRILQVQPFGFRPLYATGFVVTLATIITTTFLLLSTDSLPEIDIHKVSENKNQLSNLKKVNNPHPVLFAADYDTTTEDSIDPKNRSRFDDKIIIVNKNK